MNRKIKFIGHAVKWFDKANGNTYHSVQITKTSTGETIRCPFQYGYGDQYRQTALTAMLEAGWIPKKYGVKHPNGTDDLYSYERENNYPIEWIVTTGKKWECVEHGREAYDAS